MTHLTVMGITGQTRCDSDTSVENTMRMPFAIAFLTLLASATFAADEVYRWKDAGGIWHYSDQPRPGAEKVRGNLAPSTASTAPAAPAPAAAPPPATFSDPLPVSKEVAQQVRQESADAKAEQCKTNTATYNKLVQAPRIYKTDANGNRVYMTEAEMDAARLQARAAKDLTCGT
jgi:hypothetical protein